MKDNINKRGKAKYILPKIIVIGCDETIMKTASPGVGPGYAQEGDMAKRFYPVANDTIPQFNPSPWKD